MSVFGKIATGSPAGMAAPIHIRVDGARVERPAAYRRRNDVLQAVLTAIPRSARLPGCNLVRCLLRRLRRARGARDLRAPAKGRRIVGQAVEIGHQVGALGGSWNP